MQHTMTKSIIKIDWNNKFKFNFFTKYNYMKNEKHNIDHEFDIYVKIFAWKINSLWNKIEIKLTFKSHIYCIKHSDEQRLNKLSSSQNLKTNWHEKIAQTVWWHVAIDWFTKHHWNQRFHTVAKKWLQWIMKKTISWNQIHNQFNSYWNDECNETDKKTKNLCQIFVNSQNKKIWKV